MHIQPRLILGAALALTALFASPTIPADAASKPPPGVTVTYTDVSMGDATATHVTGVNASGVIAGYYGEAYVVDGQNYERDHHGFIKSGDTVTVVDVAGATDTFVRSINDAGTVVGSYTQDGNEHGFILAEGLVTTFDDPSLDPAGADSYGTVATGINSSGVIVGYSYSVGPDLFFYEPDPDTGFIDTDPITRNRGFVRSATGAFATYDAPGAATTGGPHVGTRLLGLNKAATMVGAYTYLVTSDGESYPMDAALVASGKKFTRLVNPAVEAVNGSCAWHEAAGINDSGVVVGRSGNGCAGTFFGWLLKGTRFTELTYVSGTETGQYAVPSSINKAGVIGGTWGTGIGGVRGFTATTN